MNLVLRMVRVFLAAWFGRRLDILDESVVPFRVWPNDLDVNLHMNNGRYLTVMDLGRMDLMIRCGLLGIGIRRRWMPVLGGASIRFRRSLAPFERYRLRTRLLCWDERSLFLEQRFETASGKLAAAGVVRGVILCRGAVVPPADILAALGRREVSPPMPASVAAWVEADRKLREPAPVA